MTFNHHFDSSSFCCLSSWAINVAWRISAFPPQEALEVSGSEDLTDSVLALGREGLDSFS